VLAAQASPRAKLVEVRRATETWTKEAACRASEFALPDGTASTFLFASVSGQLSAWGGGAQTTTASVSGTAFTGLALAHTDDGARLCLVIAIGADQYEHGLIALVHPTPTGK
jgi:hypothetical protein